MLSKQISGSGKLNRFARTSTQLMRHAINLLFTYMTVNLSLHPVYFCGQAALHLSACPAGYPAACSREWPGTRRAGCPAAPHLLLPGSPAAAVPPPAPSRPCSHAWAVKEAGGLHRGGRRFIGWLGRLLIGEWCKNRGAVYNSTSKPYGPKEPAFVAGWRMWLLRTKPAGPHHSTPPVLSSGPTCSSSSSQSSTKSSSATDRSPACKCKVAQESGGCRRAKLCSNRGGAAGGQRATWVGQGTTHLGPRRRPAGPHPPHFPLLPLLPPAGRQAAGTVVEQHCRRRWLLSLLRLRALSGP